MPPATETTSRILAGDGTRLTVHNDRSPYGNVYIELRDDGGYCSVVSAFKDRPRGKLVWSGRNGILSTKGSEPSAAYSTAATTGQSGSPSAQNARGVSSPNPTSEALADQTSRDSIAPESSRDEPQSLTAAEARGAAEQAFGRNGIANLVAKGVMNFVDSVAGLPMHLQDFVAQREKESPGNQVVSVTDHATGKVYFIADRVKAEDVPALVLHEIGEHYGLERMLGAKQYAEVLSQVRAMRDSGGSDIVNDAWDHVRSHYPSLPTTSSEFASEVLARIAETRGMSKLPLRKRILTAIRQFLFRIGLMKKLSDQDLAPLVMASLRRSMTPVRDGLDEAIADALNRSHLDAPITLADQPPTVLLALGAEAAPLDIAPSVIRKAKNKHGFTADQIKGALREISRPMMVFDSKTSPDSLVAFVETDGPHGKAVVVAIHMSRTKGTSRVVIHEIASLHARPFGQIFGWMQEGLLRYVDQRKTGAWLRPRGLQLPKGDTRHRLGKKILSPKDLRKFSRSPQAAMQPKPSKHQKMEDEAWRKAGLPRSNASLSQRLARVAEGRWAQVKESLVDDRKIRQEKIVN